MPQMNSLLPGSGRCPLRNIRTPAVYLSLLLHPKLLIGSTIRVLLTEWIISVMNDILYEGFRLAQRSVGSQIPANDPGE